MRLAARMAALVAVVSQQMCIHQAHIMGRSRQRRHAQARQLAMALCYDLTGASITDIARYFDRDRATVHHALVATRQRLAPPGSGERAQWHSAHREYQRMLQRHDDPQSILNQVRQLYRRRHTELSQLARRGEMQPEEVSRESRLLSVVLRRIECEVSDIPYELPQWSEVTPEALSTYLDALEDRLEAGGDQAGLAAVEAARPWVLGEGSAPDAPIPTMPHSSELGEEER